MPMRIIGGRARGRTLRSPAGRDVRPTLDRVREALFDMLGQRLDGLTFLDVCAGTGAVSLEALSRGAAKVVAVESQGALCRHIREEAERLGLADGLEVRRGDALEVLARLREEMPQGFDLVFVDPPWRDETLRARIVERLAGPAPYSRYVVVECPSKGKEPEIPAGVEVLRRAQYGRTRLLVLQIGTKREHGEP